MSYLREIPTYAALIAILPQGREFTTSEVLKSGAVAINAIGPFECSDFEPCDVHQMLGHLVAEGDCTVRREEIFHDSGRLESRNDYYRILSQAVEPQTADMFGR